MCHTNNMTKISRSNDFIMSLAHNRIDYSIQSYKCMLDDSSDGIWHVCPMKCSSTSASNHCSVIFKGKIDDSDIIAYGRNKFTSYGNSIHAEADAINNLKQNKRRTLISVDILVLKVKKDGKLSNSMPCVHCLRTMGEVPLTKGYRINKVYFSNDVGEIECQKLYDLINSDKLYVSSYYRYNKYNMNKWFHWRLRYNQMTS